MKYLLMKKTPASIFKAMRVMHLTAIFVLMLVVNVSATGFGQNKVSLNFKQAAITRVLNEIEDQTNYRFLYNEDAKGIRNKVGISVNNAEVKDVLDQLFQNSNLSYKLMQNNLVVIRTSEIINNKVFQLVTGTVTGEDNLPLAGVSVQVKGTTTGTTTNATGEFSLDVEDPNATLVFSYVGYELQEVPLAGRTTITVNLLPSTLSMDAVVVVGYGAQRKVDVTGSVSSVSGKEISKQSVVNPVSALQGKVAGVQITNSGAPGASPQIRIRGLGTVYGSATPLYVVDGVWFDDISFLNPADIENISILKDASSEAIYGVRAANGVVLVTTKKGRGQATINYNGYVGVQKVTNQVEMANATEYATLINEMNVSNGNPAPFTDPASYGQGTDWFDVILRPAMITDHHISVGGGSERSTYNFSLGFLSQEGIVENHDYKRITARLQNDFNVRSNLKIGYSTILQGSNSNDAPGGLFYKAFTAAPVVPVYYDDGLYGDPADYPIGSSTNNPQIQLDFFDQKSKNYRVTGNVYGELKFLRNFTFRTSFGGEFGEGEVRNYNPVYLNPQNSNVPPLGNSIQFNDTSKLSISRAQTRNWIVENTLNYNRNFGDHNLTVLLGQSAQRYKSYSVNATADNVPNNSEGDLYLSLGPNTATRPRTVSDEGDLSTYSSYFGRINYSYLNKYLLTASLRADGSSKFIGDERWGYFPSIGLGWVITNETFMDNQDIFSNLKLKGSWGKVGNASVPANLATQLVNAGAAFTAVFGGQPAPGASITSLVPPIIYWERGVGTNVGLEGTLMNNKLNFEIEWYNRETEQAIFDIPVVGSLGLAGSSIRGNQASFQNQGFEFTAGYRNTTTGDFSYNVNANFSINNNEVLSVVTGENPIYSGGAAATGGQLSTRTVVGQPIGQFFGLLVDGVFQSTAEVTGSNQPNAKPGDFRYVDQNKDGVIDAKDRVVLGSPIPRYTYGINTFFEYMGFDFTVDVQGVADVEVYNANKGLRFGSENFSKDFFENRWHGQGTSNAYPSANIGGGTNYIPNSWYVEDGSYLRIRNIQLGYTIPSSVTGRWKLQQLRIYANAQNAFNFFEYTGFTPEVGGGPLSAGIDNGIYPLSATYNVGINVTF